MINGIWEYKPTFTQEQLNARKACINASELVAIGADDWYDLWLDKTTDKIDLDLSEILPVQLGRYTEPFHLGWLYHKFDIQIMPFFKPVTERKWSKVGAMLCATPDAMAIDPLESLLDGEAAVIPVEVKHVNGWTKSWDSARDKYMPQLLGQMFVTGRSHIIFSVMFGNTHVEWNVVNWDQDAWNVLTDKAAVFWQAVQSKQYPKW